MVLFIAAEKVRVNFVASRKRHSGKSWMALAARDKFYAHLLSGLCIWNAMKCDGDIIYTRGTRDTRGHTRKLVCATHWSMVPVSPPVNHCLPLQSVPVNCLTVCAHQWCTLHKCNTRWKHMHVYIHLGYIRSRPEIFWNYTRVGGH